MIWLARDYKRQPLQVGEGDSPFLGKGRVAAHQYAEAILQRQLYGVVFRRIHTLKDYAEIQQPLIQLFQNIAAVGTVEAVLQPGVIGAKMLCGIGYKLDGIGLARADVDHSLDLLTALFYLLFGLVHKLNDLLRSGAEYHPLLGKRNALAAADEQRLAKLLLQFPELP